MESWWHAELTGGREVYNAAGQVWDVSVTFWRFYIFVLFFYRGNLRRSLQLPFYYKGGNNWCFYGRLSSLSSQMPDAEKENTRLAWEEKEGMPCSYSGLFCGRMKKKSAHILKIIITPGSLNSFLKKNKKGSTSGARQMRQMKCVQRNEFKKLRKRDILAAAAMKMQRRFIHLSPPPPKKKGAVLPVYSIFWCMDTDELTG